MPLQLEPIEPAEPIERTATRMVFSSFGVLGHILDRAEYDALRTALKTEAESEKRDGGHLLNDMLERDGGLDLTNPDIVATLIRLADDVPELRRVPEKLAAYAETQQETDPAVEAMRWFMGVVSSGRVLRSTRLNMEPVAEPVDNVVIEPRK